MFSPLATEQLSCDRFCVQEPFATSFWTVPAGWASCSTAPFDASIDTPSSNFIALMSGHTRLDVSSPWKLVKGIRFTDARPDVMVDGCQTRGAHSEISSFAPAGQRTFHDSVASHICVWSMTSETHNVLQDPTHTKSTCKAESFYLAGVAAYLTPASLTRKSYVRSFANASTRKGQFPLSINSFLPE